MTLEMIPVGRTRAYPPRVSAFTQPFWEGLRAGRWQSTCCEACGKSTFPPKPVCPHCWSDRMAWKDLAARGTLYSWTRIHSAPKVFVDEGPTYKRWRPRAYGRAYRIRKRTSHVTVVVRARDDEPVAPQTEKKRSSGGTRRRRTGGSE